MVDIRVSLSKMRERVKELPRNKLFYSFLAILTFCVASSVVLYLVSAPSLSQIKEGDIALRTIYAPYNFSYPTSIDQEKTKEARRELASKTPPVYDIDPSRQDAAFEKLGRLFGSLSEASLIPGISNREKIELVQTKTGIDLSEKDLMKLVSAKDKQRMEKAAKDTLENIFLIGIVQKTDKNALVNGKQDRITVRNTRFGIEREVQVGDIVDEGEALKISKDTLERMIPRNRSMRNVVYELIESEITPNTGPNPEETVSRKVKAQDQVLPIYKRDAVKKNELIVERGKKLTKDDIAKLTQITRIHAIVNRTAYISGLLILLIALLFSAVAYLRINEINIIRTPRHVLLISINFFLAILVSLLIVQSQVSVYIIPLASIGMLLVLLLSFNTAFIVCFIASLYVGFIVGGKLDLAFMLFVGSAAGIYAVRGARKRSQIFFAGFIVSLINLFCIAGVGFLNNVQKEAILGEGLYGILSGIISSFIVIGLLPVYEYAFSLVTNVTLLELSDLSNPLLKELTIKAPGTYHHSILVGNLAEEACDSIGANSLLARVGSYYHDIGKMEKSAYFVENEIGTASKHDKLTPSMSALIITNHAKDGVELAKKHKVNSAITDFVSQHHGTSLIYYFYQRALEKVGSEDELKEEEFRYPGPKPQTKETAIVLLADSVEASSRMLSDPTPARIRSLVEKIINNKFIDGQLDECDLTLKNLHKISESFVRVLMGVFHTRLEYPEIKSRKERKSALKDKNK